MHYETKEGGAKMRLASDLAQKSSKEGPQITVSFSPPDIAEVDIEAVNKVLRSGWITTGLVAREFEEALAQFTGAERVVVMNSCTSALQMALRALEIGPGDEVIVPAYTYSATAAVVAHVGANIVFVDSGSASYVPSVDTIAKAVTSRTKAIIVVDIGGIPFPVLDLRRALSGTGPARSVLGHLKRPAIIVDAAHSLGAARGGLRAGELGDFTAFSFHAVKNLTTGEGGALCWRKDLGIDADALGAHLARRSLHGQTKDALAKTRAGVWEYDIVETGYKANMPDILAALGLSQLSRYRKMIDYRHRVLEAYSQGLNDVVALMPHTADDFRSSAHLAMVNLGAHASNRDGLLSELADRGIASNVHYKPLPLMTAYRKMGFDIADFPNAERHYRAEITLPLHTKLTDEEVRYVISSLRAALTSSGS